MEFENVQLELDDAYWGDLGELDDFPLNENENEYEFIRGR